MDRFQKSMSWSQATESESEKQNAHSHPWDGDEAISNNSNVAFGIAENWSHKYLTPQFLSAGTLLRKIPISAVDLASQRRIQ